MNQAVGLPGPGHGPRPARAGGGGQDGELVSRIPSAARPPARMQINDQNDQGTSADDNCGKSNQLVHGGEIYMKRDPIH